MQKCANSLLKGVAFGLLVTMTVPMVMSMEDEDLEKSKNPSLKTTQNVKISALDSSGESQTMDNDGEAISHQTALNILDKNSQQIDRAMRAADRFILKQSKPLKLGGYYQK